MIVKDSRGRGLRHKSEIPDQPIQPSRRLAIEWTAQI
jgi:hypothetical protein